MLEIWQPASPVPENLLAGKALLIDKPLGWTSFDVVNRLRFAIAKHFGARQKTLKVGHAGTLDPLATGLLVVCVGAYTKKIEQIQAIEKTYTGTIRLGSTTPSFDLETEIDATFSTDHVDSDLLEKARLQFLGEIQQAPPAFSAIKIDGKRVYESARRGEEIEMKKRPVTIHRFEIERVEMPDVHFLVECSKGTYLRSLAHDFGKAVGSGGHLIALRRTASGPFSIENAWQVADLVELLKQN